jgi:CRP/FNR family transcriptional regulator, cyclic AMP receptor protein
MELMSVPVLRRLPASERARLLRGAVSCRLGRGRPLYLAGHRCSRVWLVSSGLIKLTSRNRDGVETIVRLALPGELLGDAAALDGEPYAVDAIAAAPSTVLGLDARSLITAVEGTPEALMDLCVSLAADLRQLCGAAAERATDPGPARLAGRILDLGETFGDRVPGEIRLNLPLSQKDLAQLAGISRETACRTMRRFKQTGVLDYRGRRLRILRPDLLERLRCGERGGRPYRSTKSGGRPRSRWSPEP